MLTAVVFLTVLVLESVSALDNMGPCDRNVLTDVSMEFPLFAGENGGSWSVVMAVNTSFTQSLQSLSYNLESTETADEYNLAMYYVTKSGEEGTFTTEVMTDLGNGAASSEGSDFSLNIAFLKYVPGRYAYYFICSNEGVDTTNDYRYVLAHGELSKREESEIKRLDRRNRFKGELVSLPTC